MTATLTAPAPVLLPTPEVPNLPDALRITGTEAACHECGETWELESLLKAFPTFEEIDEEVDSIRADHLADPDTPRSCYRD